MVFKSPIIQVSFYESLRLLRFALKMNKYLNGRKCLPIKKSLSYTGIIFFYCCIHCYHCTYVALWYYLTMFVVENKNGFFIRHLRRTNLVDQYTNNCIEYCSTLYLWYFENSSDFCVINHIIDCSLIFIFSAVQRRVSNQSYKPKMWGMSSWILQKHNWDPH